MIGRSFTPTHPLMLRARLLAEPCLWCWEIVDEVDGTLVESSWESEWTAFESADAAWRAGARRLSALAGGR
jgi:hypothetical protein